MSNKWTLVMTGVVVAVLSLCQVGAKAAEAVKDKKPVPVKANTTTKVEVQKTEATMVFSDPSRDPTRAAAGGVRWFWPTHMRNFERRKAGNIDLAFLGDSITQGWPGDLFGKSYGKLNAVNFGCGGDKIQNLLMRLEGDDGELKGTSPKVIVLLIGINNMGDNSAEEIAYGIDNMVKRLMKECSKSKILVLAILPTRDGISDKMKATNKLIAKLDNGKAVRFLDMGPKFMGKDGKVLEGVHSDGVHLTHKGYEIWVEAMNPLLMEMMGSSAAKHEKPGSK